MVTVCWAAKGGSGTTVVACALALVAAGIHDGALLVDTAGDVPAALGMAEPSGAGVHDWLASPSALPEAFESLGTAAADGLVVIHRGTVPAPTDAARWEILGNWSDAQPRRVIVDAGSSPPPALLACAQQRLLVIRPCYLALRRAAAGAEHPTGVIVVHEPGRALRAEDVAYAVQAPIVAEVSTDPAVARAVDAGLLAARLPRSLAVALRDVLA